MQARSDAYRAQLQADTNHTLAMALAEKVRALEAQLKKTGGNQAGCLMVIRAMNDMLDAMPPLERERFRDKLVQKARGKIDEISREDKHDYYADIKESTTLKALGVVKSSGPGRV